MPEQIFAQARQSLKRILSYCQELESVLPGDRIAYAVETLAKAFYPDVFE